MSCPPEPVLPALSLIEVSAVEVSGHLLFYVEMVMPAFAGITK